MDSSFNLAIDEATADRILSGRVEPDDAPPAYAAVVSLIAAVSDMQVPMTPVMERMTLDSMASAIEALPADLPVERPRSSANVRSKFFRAKVVGALVFSSVVGTAGLAMAGALPRPAQDIASTMLAKIGVSAPHPDAVDQNTHATPAGHTTPDSGSGQGSVISGIAHGTTGAKGPTVCQAASDGKCQAGEHGHGVKHGTPGQQGNGSQDGQSQDGSDNAPAPTPGPGDEGNGSATSHGDGSGNSASHGSGNGSGDKGAGSGNTRSHH